MKLQLQLFSKAPVPGAVKTRLIPALGAAGAARLQQWMTNRMVEQAVVSGLGEVVLYCAPDCTDPFFVEMQNRHRLTLLPQQEGDIGERMAAAMGLGLQQCDGVLLMGCDCPQLDSAVLLSVAEQLQSHDVVLVPAEDGGYVLVAMRRPLLQIFSGISWSSITVLSQTEAILENLGVTWRLLPPLRDIDRPEDLEQLPQEWRNG